MKALLLFALMASAGTERVTLEVRLVVPCSNPNAGPPLKDPDAAGSICLDRTPFLTEHDVESAEIHRKADKSPVIFLTFHHDAAMRELQVTLRHIGGRVSIAVNGRVISAPKISGGSRLLFVDGKFTEARAVAIVQAFNDQVRR
jgi:preprotein translocase subunit SecD